MSASSDIKGTAWTASLSQEWDVLGPFPIHAREQHFLSPSFPLNLSRPIDFNATYPSAYADGGSVGWTKVQSRDDHNFEVTFPNIRWDALRATEGWAALQHHSVLHSTLIVHPPSHPGVESESPPPRLLVELIQGAFFTVLPVNTGEEQLAIAPEWHAGNIYALSRSQPNAVKLPTPPSAYEPTTYDIFVSGDYEIRLFGDPGHGGVPKLSISVTVDVEQPVVSVVHSPSHDVSANFVEGWAFGNAFGVGLRSVDGWWTVDDIKATGETANDLKLEVVQKTRLAPNQQRIVPIRLLQTGPLKADKLEFTLTIVSDEETRTVDVVIPVVNHAHWDTSAGQKTSIKASYFYASSTPTEFLVAPPAQPNASAPSPPILALHGAGVDIFANTFWIQAIPRQEHSWVITPSGRTEWGFDWHGPSAQDAWGTVDALHAILSGREQWQDWSIAPNSKVLLMGHSNGGQGAWYLAARYPDRVVGVVAAAGYIKSQAYVPWTLSRSAHYIDPALRAILDSSLTPDDNDLFLSNLVDTSVVAIHGGDDENVPVWHTREAVSVLKAWNPEANVTYREDPGEPHWYPSVFENDEVRASLSSMLERANLDDPKTSRKFTLTVSIPGDSGSFHGFKIIRVEVPGRLARLTVTVDDGAIWVRTSNVKAFSVHFPSVPRSIYDKPLYVDGWGMSFQESTWRSDYLYPMAHVDGFWMLFSEDATAVVPRTGRLANILLSNEPLIIVVPTKQPSRELSAALRIAHNLDVYHKLDAEIIDDKEASERLSEASQETGNAIFLGLGAFAKSVLAQGKTAFGVQDDDLALRGRRLNEPSTAALFLHPHPSREESLLLFLHGADAEGLERGLRLFPIRTGVTVPDWIVVGSQADARGSGGVEGAGVWGNDWSWSEALSAF
ncbi:hypothetical protein BD413DRAFT_600635 [Trametes elegans]|nr:hypothetical protein BD413DRAFT_600635 [Trametes elegans]